MPGSPGHESRTDAGAEDTGRGLQTEDSLRVTYAGAKRRIAVLEQQLQVLHEAGTKRKA
jgi:hypothetical protein